MMSDFAGHKKLGRHATPHAGGVVAVAHARLQPFDLHVGQRDVRVARDGVGLDPGDDQLLHVVGVWKGEITY